MAAHDAVLSSLLTTAGLDAVYVNLDSKQPYNHAHTPVAECLLNYSYTEDDLARFCFHHECDSVLDWHQDARHGTIEVNL